MEAANTKPLLVHRHENLMFGLAIIATISIMIYIFLSIVGIFIFVIIALITLFSHAISMSHIQVNGVRIRENQFPFLYEKVAELSGKMELKQIPEAYIIESGGILNAFATKVLGLFGKNMVVLYSDFVDIALESEGHEIDYVIAHELAHIKRNHIVKTLLIFPAMWLPFVGVAYSRMAEYTCDRMAAYYTGKPESAINGLLIFAAGRRLYKTVQLKEYQEQYNEKKGVFVTLAELLSTHPPIPKRIQEIEKIMYGSPSTPLIKRTKQVFAIMFLFFFLLPAATTGLVVAGFFVLEELDFLPFSDYAEYTPLMDAAMENDIETVQQLIHEGVDINEQNEYGESALTVAIINEHIEVIHLLLENGADPNLEDDTGWTPLMTAVMTENLEVGEILLEAGADPTHVDEYDMNAIDHAKDINLDEYVELLESYTQ